MLSVDGVELTGKHYIDASAVLENASFQVAAKLCRVDRCVFVFKCTSPDSRTL